MNMIKFIDLNTGKLFDASKPYVFFFDGKQSTKLIYSKQICFLSDTQDITIKLDSPVFQLVDLSRRSRQETINDFQYYNLKQLTYNGSAKITSLTSRGTSYSSYYLHSIYIIASCSQFGQYEDSFNVGENEYQIGADFYDEDESLLINLANQGQEIPESIQRAIYTENLHEEENDNVLLNRKWKELLLNSWDTFVCKGSYKSLINCLNWFEYGDLLNISEYWKHHVCERNFLHENDLSSTLTDKFKDSLTNYAKTTYIGLHCALEKPKYLNDKLQYDDGMDKNPKLINVTLEWTKQDMALKLSMLGAFFETYFMPVHLDLIHSTIEDIVFTYAIKDVVGSDWLRDDYVYFLDTFQCSVKDGSQFVISNVNAQVGPNTMFGHKYDENETINYTETKAWDSYDKVFPIGVDVVADGYSEMSDEDMKTFWSQYTNYPGTLVPFRCVVESYENSPIIEETISFKNKNGEDIIYKDHKIFTSNIPNNQIWYISIDDDVINFDNVNYTSNIYKNGIGVLVFEDDVTTIQEKQFDYCEKLKYIILPNSIQTIKERAFQFCSNLTSITIPSSVISIETQAFWHCSNFQDITLLNDDATAIDLDEEAFFQTKLKHIHVPYLAIEDYKTKFNEYETLFDTQCKYKYYINFNLLYFKACKPDINLQFTMSGGRTFSKRISFEIIDNQQVIFDIFRLCPKTQDEYIYDNSAISELSLLEMAYKGYSEDNQQIFAQWLPANPDSDNIKLNNIIVLEGNGAASDSDLLNDYTMYVKNTNKWDSSSNNKYSIGISKQFVDSQFEQPDLSEYTVIRNDNIFIPQFHQLIKTCPGYESIEHPRLVDEYSEDEFTINQDDVIVIVPALDNGRYGRRPLHYTKDIRDVHWKFENMSTLKSQEYPLYQNFVLANNERKVLDEGYYTISLKYNINGIEQTIRMNSTIKVKYKNVKALKFTSKGGSTLGITNNGGNTPNLEYSTDGENWIEWDYSTLAINDGESVYLRGDNPNGFSSSASVYSNFVMTGSLTCKGNVMHLLNYKQDLTIIPCDYCFCYIFEDCESLTTAPELPATTLTHHCYDSMFSGCTSLKTAPELPATTLASNCYNGMFENCTSLKTAPTLPATTLTNYCYQLMFSSCTSLTTAPELPATTLADGCYQLMFNSCTSLTTAPELPATTLADSCYTGMFMFCTSLTAAPELPATTLAGYCYQLMFESCISLTTAPELPATTLADGCYYDMFSFCTHLTTAPELPATTLAESCYRSMFYWCTHLTTAPELPATTLAPSCYRSMFYWCSKLNNITMLATDISASNCLSNWVQLVSSTGTFKCASGMSTKIPRGDNGIPRNWTVVEENP